jgi:multimeric flavodoxin WrbA
MTKSNTFKFEENMGIQGKTFSFFDGQNNNEINITGIVGSPRKGMYTDTLINAALDGCRSKGACTGKIYLNDLNIKPCQACRVQDGMGCKFHDDMDIIKKAFEESNGIILGVPVYYGLMCSQIKLMVDRSYCCAKRVFLPSGEIAYQTTVKSSKIGLLVTIAHVFLQQQSIVDSLNSWGNEINLKFIDEIHFKHKDIGIETMEYENIKKDFFRHGELLYDAILNATV